MNPSVPKTNRRIPSDEKRSGSGDVVHPGRAVLEATDRTRSCHERLGSRGDSGFRDLDVRALGRGAGEGRAPTSCCSSASDARRRFNTSAPAGVIRYTRASRDRLGSVARSQPRRAIRASNGYNVPGLSRYPCRCSSSSIHCPYTPCSSAWCRMWIFQNPSKNSRTTGSVIGTCLSEPRPLAWSLSAARQFQAATRRCRGLRFHRQPVDLQKPPRVRPT